MSRPVRLFLVLLLIFCLVLFGYYLFLKLKEPTTSSSLPITHNVQIISDSSSFSVKFSNKDFLMKKLDEIRFWGEEAISTYQVVPSAVTATSLTIHLTDIPFSNEILRTQGKTPSGEEKESDALKIAYNSTGKLDVYIYLNSDDVKTDTIEKLGTSYSARILSYLFALVHPYITGDLENKRALDQANFRDTIFKLPKYSFLVISK